MDAVSRAVALQALPGVADIYIGKIDDTVFFNRSRRINAATDLDYGKIGGLKLAGTNLLDIEIKTWSRGESPFSGTLTMSGIFPQTRTGSSSTMFVTNLVSGLVSNFSLRIPLLDLGLLNLITDVVVELVKTIVVGVLSPILGPILSDVVDPLLQLLGIRLGQVIVTVNGVCEACGGFSLATIVDKTNASPGARVTYTITYTNRGSTTLNNVKIANVTPTSTTFSSATCGVLATGLSGGTVASNPEVGSAGSTEWFLTGTLSPGATGTVTMDVLVQ